MTLKKEDSSIKLPGFGLPVNHVPTGTHSWDQAMFPNALDYKDIDGGWCGQLNVQREITMMQIMNSISEKPDWDKKVFDENITSKWRTEALESGQDVTTSMMDWVIKEMQWKTEQFAKDGLIRVFDIGVMRSDSVVSEDLRLALRDAVIPLENVPDDKKDYHPGSDNMVLDLVHPSLFPVVYGCTRILPERTIALNDCLGTTGEGEVLKVPSEEDAAGPVPRQSWRFPDAGTNPYSRKFQWLPCEVQFLGETECKIVSYINNLHPVEHRPLYGIVEKIIASAIPLWDESLEKARGYNDDRIEYLEAEYLPSSTPEPEPGSGSDEDSDEYNDRREQWEASRPMKLPEPGEFSPPNKGNGESINLREKFSNEGLQVIVKLANIELTPEKPEYDGGAWHIEGQLNERICATAIYYYDSDNITESILSFRQRAGSIDTDISYEQDRHEFLQTVFGFGPEVDGRNDGPITQNLGGVLCKQGRLITFPNIVQHRVAPFTLADRSRPGHRKILALFLIDPNRRIISSANVPPQQEDWGKEKREVVQELLSQRLPRELQQIVSKDGIKTPMTLEEAKAFRLELMEERSSKQSNQNAQFEIGSFSLCEH